jgi:hypothetical protein
MDELIVHIIIILSVSLIPACMFLSLFYLEKNIRWLDLHLPMHLVLVTLKDYPEETTVLRETTDWGEITE